MNSSHQTTIAPAGAGNIDSSRFQALFSLEQAAKYVEKCQNKDNSASSLLQLLNVTQQSGPTCSGLVDHDYPTVMPYPGPHSHMLEMKAYAKVPLPQEIMENFNRILFITV